jgi:hypothetical protein
MGVHGMYQGYLYLYLIQVFFGETEENYDEFVILA